MGGKRTEIYREEREFIGEKRICKVEGEICSGKENL